MSPEESQKSMHTCYKRQLQVFSQIFLEPLWVEGKKAVHMVVKPAGSAVRLLGFKSQTYHLLTL